MASKPKGRTPDFNVKAMNKETSRGHRIGAAWLNDNGSISFELDEFVVLFGKDKTTVITLFPWEEKTK